MPEFLISSIIKSLENSRIEEFPNYSIPLAFWNSEISKGLARNSLIPLKFSKIEEFINSIEISKMLLDCNLALGV
jgi:hypothetical protein